MTGSRAPGAGGAGEARVVSGGVGAGGAGGVRGVVGSGPPPVDEGGQQDRREHAPSCSQYEPHTITLSPQQGGQCHSGLICQIS